MDKQHPVVFFMSETQDKQLKAANLQCRNPREQNEEKELYLV